MFFCKVDKLLKDGKPVIHTNEAALRLLALRRESWAVFEYLNSSRVATRSVPGHLG